MEARAGYELETVKPRHNEALVEVEQSRAVAETQAALVIAKRFPRDQIAAMDKIQNACTRPGLAEAALYEYARGGTAITGPSIRLAEAIAQAWGNVTFGIRELEQRSGVSTVEAFAWDVESNTRQVKIFQVKHERYTRQGSYRLNDPRDIYELTANMGARRLRACILGVVPGDVVEAAVHQCEETLKAKAKVTPERIASLVEKFGEFKVTKAQIEKRIQKRLDAISSAQLVNLGKIYNSLKDGMSAAADWFEPIEGEDGAAPKAESLKDKLKAGKKKAQAAPQEPDPIPDMGEAENVQGGPETEAPERVVKCPKDGQEAVETYCRDYCKPEDRAECGVWGK
jgi:hypothetical protein